MNIDDTRMIAKMHAHARSSVSSVASAVRGAGVACVFACMALVAMTAAQAQDRGGFHKDDLGPPQQQQPRDDRGGQRQDVTPRFDQRDQRAADDAHRQQQERNADAQRRSGRLTPDERRDLRRQINEAGVDLYPNTPRR